MTNSITGLCTVDGSVSKIMKEDHQLFTSRSDQAPKVVFHSFCWCHKSVCGFLRLHLSNFKVDPEKYISCVSYELFPLILVKYHSDLNGVTLSAAKNIQTKQLKRRQKKFDCVFTTPVLFILIFLLDPRGAGLA